MTEPCLITTNTFQSSFFLLCYHRCHRADSQPPIIAEPQSVLWAGQAARPWRLRQCVRGTRSPLWQACCLQAARHSSVEFGKPNSNHHSHSCLLHVQLQRSSGLALVRHPSATSFSSVRSFLCQAPERPFIFHSCARRRSSRKWSSRLCVRGHNYILFKPRPSRPIAPLGLRWL